MSGVEPSQGRRVRPFSDPAGVGPVPRVWDRGDSAGNTAHPFAALLAPPSPPVWHGPASVYRLLDLPTPKPIVEAKVRRPRTCRKTLPRWVPWTLMTPQLEAEVAAGKWDMSNLWPFPAKDNVTA